MAHNVKRMCCAALHVLSTYKTVYWLHSIYALCVRSALIIRIMKVTLKIELEFESWFEDDREPKSKEEWADFFNSNLMPEGSILGVDDGEYQDIIALNTYNIECLDVS